MGPGGHVNVWVLVKTLPSLGQAAFSLSGHSFLISDQTLLNLSQAA